MNLTCDIEERSVINVTTQPHRQVGSIFVYFYSKEYMSSLHGTVCKVNFRLIPLYLKDKSFNPLSALKSEQKGSINGS